MPAAAFDHTVRDRRRLINFGVVSLARVLGEWPEKMLTLRCECGVPDCLATVEMRAGEYRDELSGVVMVACGHETVVPGDILALNDRFATVAAETQPTGAETLAQRSGSSRADK